LQWNRTNRDEDDDQLFQGYRQSHLVEVLAAMRTSYFSWRSSNSVFSSGHTATPVLLGQRLVVVGVVIETLAAKTVGL
jgi:hypothetical protein